MHSKSFTSNKINGKYLIFNIVGSGGFGGGFNMNPMALAGMMSMFMNQMGALSNMGGGGMGGGVMGGNMGMGSGDGFKSSNYHSGNAKVELANDGGLGYGSQSSSLYGDQAPSGMGDMSSYANAMSAMFNAAGMNPANVQAALYSAYGGGNAGSGGSNQIPGVYDQSSSSYGPSRTSNAVNRGYKPY